MNKASTNPITHHFNQQIDVHAALKQRNSKTNVWFCDSPKSGKRCIIKGDIAFYALKLAEGEPTIVDYEVDPLCAVDIYGLNYAQQKTTALVNYSDGRQALWTFYWSTNPHAQVVNAHKTGHILPQWAGKGLVFKTFTEKDFKGREIELDNWLLLTAAINRAQTYITYQEEQICQNQVAYFGSVALENLLNYPEVDPALMLASVGKLLQKGILTADLKNDLFGLTTEIKVAP